MSTDESWVKSGIALFQSKLIFLEGVLVAFYYFEEQNFISAVMLQQNFGEQLKFGVEQVLQNQSRNQTFGNELQQTNKNLHFGQVTSSGLKLSVATASIHHVA